VATGLQKAEKLCLRVRASCSGRNLFWPVKKLELANGPALSVPWGKGEPGEVIAQVTSASACHGPKCLRPLYLHGVSSASRRYRRHRYCCSLRAFRWSCRRRCCCCCCLAAFSQGRQQLSHTTRLIKKRLKYTKP
jgi:hypothetical protein